jgi:hypothetical protein
MAKVGKSLNICLLCFVSVEQKRIISTSNCGNLTVHIQVSAAVYFVWNTSTRGGKKTLKGKFGCCLFPRVFSAFGGWQTDDISDEFRL